MTRKQTIEASFARHAHSYDANCEIQARVSSRLGELLPDLKRPDVLELGCGTGVFTRRLLAHYPAGRFVISDFSQEMIGACALALKDGVECELRVIDADKLETDKRFDLIVSSLATHWFDEPLRSLELQRQVLKPGGRVLYSTIGFDNFPQWQEVLLELGLKSGVCPGPVLPGLVLEERVTIDYGNARGFLNALKQTGACVARAGYTPLTPGELKRACHLFDERFQGRVSWHIVYGIIEGRGRRVGLADREKVIVEG